MAKSLKKWKYAALFFCFLMLLSNNDRAMAEGFMEEEINVLSKEDVDIINNLKLLEMMELFEDYDVIESYNSEEEDDV